MGWIRKKSRTANRVQEAQGSIARARIAFYSSANPGSIHVDGRKVTAQALAWCLTR